MTRINSINSQNCNPLRRSRNGHSKGAAIPRITPTAAELVNDEPIEEVIFEANNGIDQRSSHRGYVITEPVEEVLVERLVPTPTQEHFWQGFSTPFMAQVIGQNAAPADRRTRAYAHAASTKAGATRPHLRLAC